MISKVANLNESWLRKAPNKRRKGSDKTCFPAFQKPNPRNLHAALWRRIVYLLFEPKTKKIEQDSKNELFSTEKEIFWKFTLFWKKTYARLMKDQPFLEQNPF